MKYSVLKWTFPCLGMAVLAFTLSSVLPAQTVKQLKEPKTPTTVHTEASDVQAGQTEKTDIPTGTQVGKASSAPSDNTIVIQPNASGSSSQESYSVVIENKVGPDGKQIRTRKVWKNGTLVESKEETVEPGENADTSITLPDGETAPGMVLRSERFGDTPFEEFEEMNGSPFEMMEQFRQQMLQRQQAQAEAFRQYCEQNGIPMNGNFSGMPFAPSTVQRPVNMSEYWIGTSVQPVPEFLAAQLDIPEETGLLVADVVPNSPADKAGIQRHDILLKIGNTVIKSISEIGEAVDRDKEKVQKIEIFRKGKKQVVDLTPEKRPTEQVIGGGITLPGDRQSIKVVRPGIIVPGTKTEKIVPGTKAEKKSEKIVPGTKSEKIVPGKKTEK